MQAPWLFVGERLSAQNVREVANGRGGRHKPFWKDPTIRATRSMSQPVAETVSDYSRFARNHLSFVESVNGLRKEFNRRCQMLVGLRGSQQHTAVRQLLRIPKMRRLHAFDALKACGQLRGATPASVDDLANNYNPFGPVLNEPAVWMTLRPGGRKRSVLNFGPIRRMHHKSVARVLRSLHPPLREQFLFNGGMPMALQAIEAAISAGATHSCELDFVDFYGSVRFDDLAEVMRPLPSSVTQHVVWDTHLRERRLILGGPCSSPTPEPPNGFLLGSAVSSIAGEVLIARLLQAAQLPGIITYADNLCVLGRSEEEVAARIHQLQRVLLNPPFACVSGLRLRQYQIRNVTNDVAGPEFANHEAIIGPVDKSSHSVSGWKPSSTKLEQFEISTSAHVSVDAINRAITKVSNWRRYYASWPEGDLYEAEYLASLMARRFTLVRSPENKASAIAAVVNAFLLWSGEEGFDGGYNTFLPGLGSPAEEELAQSVEQRLSGVRQLLRQPPLQ